MFNFFKKSAPTSPAGKSTTIKFKINGMHCVSCGLNIDGELEEIPGVLRAETSYAKQVTKIEFDQEKVQPAELKKAVEKLGYGVE